MAIIAETQTCNKWDNIFYCNYKFEKNSQVKGGGGASIVWTMSQVYPVFDLLNILLTF